MSATQRQFKGIELKEVIDSSQEANSEIQARLYALVMWGKMISSLPPEEYKKAMLSALETAEVGE